MSKLRKQLISLDATPYYYCVSRCMRRAFLCGVDRLTNKNYEHRRQWIEQRIHLLSQVFAIDVCAYAVMSNHVHIVLHIHKAKSLSWSNKDVAIRWHRLYKGTTLTHKYIKRETLTKEELEAVTSKLVLWRNQL